MRQSLRCGTASRNRSDVEMRRAFVLDSKALALGRASDVLAIDPKAIGATLALSSAAPEGFGSSELIEGARIACVEVLGPIAQRGDTLCGFFDGYDTIAARLGAALEDPSVDAVVMVIDSPGGDAAGMVEGVRRMRAAVEASGKPVLAYADELAASAAYALATVADDIYIPASGQVGSIGMVMVHVDESAALDMAGVKPTIIRSGPQKYTGSALEPLSAEAQARMKGRVDTMAEQFAALVAGRRGKTPAAWLALEGAVFGGAAAVNAGLADGVASRDQVMAKAARLAGGNKMATIDGKGASPQDVAALEVGRAAMALTGAERSEDALRTLRGWQADAGKAKALEAERAASVAAAEKVERVELVRSMVARGALLPPKAWLPGEKGHAAENGVAEPWASMPIESLRAVAPALEEQPARKAATPAPMKSANAVTPEIEAKARQNGIKPESLVAASSLGLMGSGRGEI